MPTLAAIADENDKEFFKALSTGKRAAWSRHSRSWCRRMACTGFQRSKETLMNTTVIHETLAKSQAGELIFPEVVRRLLEVGVESYFCDLANGAEVFYMTDGKSHAEKYFPLMPIAEAIP